MKYTAILSDLDGTLFRNDKSISDFTKRQIKAAQDAGILFGISTSRAVVNALKFLGGISPDILITNGGGLVYFRGQKIYSCEFSAKDTQSLIAAAFKVFGQDIVLSADNESGLYSNSKDELGDKFWTYRDFRNLNEPFMKICIKTVDRERVAKTISLAGLSNVDFLPFSDIPWFKISRNGATKQKAIEALCAHLKISPKHIVAFGDDFNDIGMIKLCGMGVAMQNAIEEVKRCADELCDSNENDGVAKWIEKLLLL